MLLSAGTSHISQFWNRSSRVLHFNHMTNAWIACPLVSTVHWWSWLSITSCVLWCRPLNELWELVMKSRFSEILIHHLSFLNWTVVTPLVAVVLRWLSLFCQVVGTARVLNKWMCVYLFLGIKKKLHCEIMCFIKTYKDII